MPWIERIEVEDGFLDGLDLALSPGLNVVIGARGTGKTSLLELLRFVVGAPAFTEQAGALGKAQVEAILGRGRVTATIRHDNGEVESVSRTVGSPAAAGLAATVLAQNEIEAVGASARGRLHLIDRFIDQGSTGEMDRLTAEIAVAARSVDAGREEIDSLEERVTEIAAVDAELQQLRGEQEQAFERASATEADRQRLDELQQGLQALALRGQLLDQAAEALRNLRGTLSAAGGASNFPGWPEEAGENPTVSAQSAYASVLATLGNAEQVLDNALADVEAAASADASVRRQSEDAARDLRRQLGAMDVEISRLANRIAELNERLGLLRGLEERLRERERQMLDAVRHRDELFNALDDLREERHARRAGEVERLNDNLRRTIQIELVQSGAIDDYTNEIVRRLRGSGLHASTLAPELAQALSPLELVSAIESWAVADVAALTGLSTNRVEAAFNQLRAQDPSGLVSVPIEDTVDLYLLDGTSLKPSVQLSIGQRCTVVLPILLQRHGDVLVIDQPEDHLDNAFVTSTLVETLRQRESGDQVILASHNANVPVLGEADLVVHMASDGRRGFVLHAGALDDPDTVQAVTDVMEGGADAFQRRADFYAEHGHGERT